MQNVYITRNGKQIQLTVDEIKAAWAAWDAETRKQQLETYKEEVKQTLLKLSKDKNDIKYKKTTGDENIIDEIARCIQFSIERGCTYFQCFDTSEYGDFINNYKAVIEVWGEVE